MSGSYPFVELQVFCQELLSPCSAAAVLTPEGQTVFLKYQTLADIGTLPMAVQTSHKYLQIEDGDIVVTNDPYSGGSILSSVTLVMGVQPLRSVNRKAAALLLAQRISFKPRLNLSDSVEGEGLRIPPTPLRKDQKMNAELLEIIGAHPQAPEKFKESLQEAMVQLLRMREKIRNFSETLNLDWSKPALKKFFQRSQQLVRERLSEVAVGEAQFEMPIDDKSKIRLRMEVSEQKVLFDFSGTDAASQFHLTDAATFGACTGALLAAIGGGIPLNSGVFDAIEVLSPSGSLVNAKYPRPVFSGMTDGAAMVANLVLKVFGLIDSKRQFAMSGISQCSFQLDFGPNSWFFETLETGSAASDGTQGTPGLSVWRRTRLNPSVEEIENRYPITLKTYAYRANSGGGGAYGGGDGVVKSVRVDQAGRLKWMITEPLLKPEGVQGGKSASPAEIFLQIPGEEKQRLHLKGEMDLPAGSIVTLHSAGGGGYGAED